jgi:hypothetical protein
MTTSAIVPPTEKSPPRETLSSAAPSIGDDLGILMPSIDVATRAMMHRRAARMNASSISEEEEKKLHAERHALLDKEFNKTITRQEILRLEYVRWSLDRIDDAKHGAKLDAIERRLVRFEQFAAEVDDFKKRLIQVAAGDRRGGRKQHR